MNIFPQLKHTAISSAAAFSDMYERNHSSVFRYLYSVVNEPIDDIEDLTAEIFMRAWKARYLFKGTSDTAIAWLIGIAKHLAVDNYRRKAAQKISRLGAEIKAESTTEEEIVVLQQKQELRKLLQELPADSREILVLRYTLGWRVNEIAAHMELTENHVSVMIHRALADLREQWTV